MSAAQQHDVAKLIAAYSPKLKAFIRKRVRTTEDAEDILQDVFYQLVKAVNITLSPIEQISAWLYRVARNISSNHSNKKREEAMPMHTQDENEDGIWADFSEILLANSETIPSPEMDYLRSLFWMELEQALAELPPEQRMGHK
jgi:RNA polymerase sigma factor (sigma-70 family)